MTLLPKLVALFFNHVLILYEVHKSFLLIDRTDHIVTLSSSVGYTVIPAYGRILQRQRVHLWTIIVIADIDEGFGHSASTE